MKFVETRLCQDCLVGCDNMGLRLRMVNSSMYLCRARCKTPERRDRFKTRPSVQDFSADTIEAESSELTILL